MAASGSWHSIPSMAISCPIHLKSFFGCGERAGEPPVAERTHGAPTRHLAQGVRMGPLGVRGRAGAGIRAKFKGWPKKLRNQEK